ncbi:MAG TPA: hypothetical protein VL443_18240 [Cyclobacteriaceae bacterium]|jgi:hypothetical protein|nr:hypothetical protein [Cyclobacteriaceae bacterium]
MCRYSFKRYKSHYVCFNCHKTFKQFSTEDLIIRDGLWEQYRKAYLESNRRKSEAYREEHPEIVQLLGSKYFNRKYPCPQCTTEMADMGMDFKAPKSSDIKAWEIIQGMYKLGHAFHSCGCNGPGYIPHTEEAYADYLVKHLKLYQEMLDSRTGEQNPEDLEHYLNYWTGKLNSIKEELNKLKLPLYSLEK